MRLFKHFSYAHLKAFNSNRELELHIGLYILYSILQNYPADIAMP